MATLLGKKFGSKPSSDSERTRRLQKCLTAVIPVQSPAVQKEISTPLLPRSPLSPPSPPLLPPLTAQPDEVLDSDGSSDCHDVSCLFTDSDIMSEYSSRSVTPASTHSRPMSVASNSSYMDCASRSEASLHTTVNVALAARIQSLEIENDKLRKCMQEKKLFHICDISHDDSLYTGFPSYDVLVSYFEFLGHAAYHLTYIGSKSTGQRNQMTKLNPFNQFFLTLKLDLNERDIAVRFGISTSTVSQYFITWICFMYIQRTY